MSLSYHLARDHLEQALCILHENDPQTRQLRAIVERTLALMSEVETQGLRREGGNVLDFVQYRADRRKQS